MGDASIRGASSQPNDAPEAAPRRNVCDGCKRDVGPAWCCGDIDAWTGAWRWLRCVDCCCGDESTNTADGNVNGREQ